MRKRLSKARALRNHLTPSVAWLNLTYNPKRLVLLLGGIAFAVILMFMFTGFKNALYDSQLQLIEKLNGELFIISDRRVSIGIPKAFPLYVLRRAEASAGVESATPLYLGEAFWKNPETKLVRLVRVIGFNVARPLFKLPELQPAIADLQRPNTVSIDRRARPELGRLTPGTRTELANRQVQVVGNFTIGNDFASLNGNLITSEENFLRYFAARDPKIERRSLQDVDIGVVQLAPDRNPEAVATALRQQMQSSHVSVLTEAGIAAWEKTYWQTSTNIGFIFGFLTLMGFFIGIILCYQILYSDIADHLQSYATLKAIGYRNLYFSKVIMQQSFLLGGLGFIPGFLISYQLYVVAAAATGLVFNIQLDRVLQILALTLLMCAISGLISMLKVQQSDPTDIF